MRIFALAGALLLLLGVTTASAQSAADLQALAAQNPAAAAALSGSAGSSISAAQVAAAARAAGGAGGGTSLSANPLAGATAASASPSSPVSPTKNSDVGGSHVSFYVTDIAKAVAYLKSVPGVTVLGNPTPVSGQNNGGEQFVYFSTPWGLMMELVTYNKGLDYEKTTKKRLFSVK